MDTYNLMMRHAIDEIRSGKTHEQVVEHLKVVFPHHEVRLLDQAAWDAREHLDN